MSDLANKPRRISPSVQTYSGGPATWGWKAWCQRGAIVPTVADDRRTGSR